MKIEMGESLFYSWLRHVKECQIVQTNWTTASQWPLLHERELVALMQDSDDFFNSKYGYRIYKQTATLSQFLQQAECDALGISMQQGQRPSIYAVDVAFHELGLNYGNKDTTTMKVLAKCIRSAMCIYGYLDSKEAEIIFASPKIHKNVLSILTPCISELQCYMNQKGYTFNFRLIANGDFNVTILQPLLLMSKGIADTNELFLRSYQLIQLFEKASAQSSGKSVTVSTSSYPKFEDSSYNELRIGQLAQTVMRGILEKGISNDELSALQDPDFSRANLGLGYPALVPENAQYDRSRYYVRPLQIHGNNYMLCSQWFEKPSRQLLVEWIRKHTHPFN